MENTFVIIGASGHAKVVIEIIEEMKGKIVGVFDNDPLIRELLGYEVFQVPSFIAPAIIAIGNNSLRKKINTVNIKLFRFGFKV